MRLLRQSYRPPRNAIFRDLHIYTSTNSIDTLNDQIDELVLTADGAITRIKEIQSRVSENFTVDSAVNSEAAQENEAQNSGNNLTKSSTPAYTQEYQAKSTLESEQVI